MGVGSKPSNLSMQSLVGQIENIEKKKKTRKQKQTNKKTNETKAPFIWRKALPGKEVTQQAESSLASVYTRKKLTPLPESRAGSAWSDHGLALTELTWLGEPKRL